MTFSVRAIAKLAVFPPRRVVVIISLLSLAAVLIVVHVKLMPYAEDDAYIHIRIAENLARLGRPYFNVSEAINASSSPAWTLILALVFKAFANVPLAIAILNALFTVGGAAIHTLFFARTMGREASNWLCLLFAMAYLAITLVSSIELMETPLALLMLGIALYLVVRKNRLSLVVCGALPFFRPELVGMLGLILLYVVWYQRFALIEIVVLAASGMLPFLLYDLYYFGSLVPNSLLAKSRVYQINYPVALVVTVIFGAAIVIYLSARKLLRTQEISRQALSLMEGFGALTLATYFVSRVLLFPWYLPIYAIPLLYTIYDYFISDIHSVVAKRMVVAIHAVFHVGTGTWLLMIILSGLLAMPNWFPGFQTGARTRQYLQLGAEIYKACPQATAVITHRFLR